MGSFSIWHWLIVLVVVIIVFGGRGRLSHIMQDLGEGIKTFKKQVRDDDEHKGHTPPSSHSSKDDSTPPNHK